ncbi:MAG: response regulator [Desulfobacteraceae bacterium]|nr:response regulator [Desulfobacteraceae bacterium]
MRKHSKKNIQKEKIFDQVGFGILVVNSNSKIILDINQTAADLIGCKRNDIIGKSIDDVFSKINISIQKSITKLDDDTSLISFSDISSLKDHEEKLIRENEDLKDFFYNIPVAAYRNTGGAKGKFLLINPALIELHGFETFEEFYSVSVKDLYQNSDDRIAFTSELKKRGHVRKKELKLKKKDGTPFWAAVTAKVKKNDLGEVQWIDGVIEDITLRKKYEEELISEKVKAQQAVKTKSEFLANMSHEIRTPMNGVIGMLDVLMETDISYEQKEFALSAQQSADSLLSLINDILDFSKIEAGKLSTEIIDFKLSTTIESLSDVMGLKAFEKGIEFASLIHEDVPLSLRGDPGRLRQILTNLSGNAVKFTQKGDVFIRVSVKEDRNQATLLLFEVIDTGIGIPEDKINILFDSFTQVDASTTRKYGGTGLGLAISKQLVELMGGTIGIKSELGQGSTFWFTGLFEKQKVSQEKIVLPANIESKRILIVDDMAINHEVFAEYLKSWHCRFSCALSAEKAIDMLVKAKQDNDPYEIALIDMQMPEMSGEHLGKHIKENQAIQNTIMVMLSSSAYRGDAQKMQDIGFAAFLTKPIKRDMLFDCIRAVLSLSQKPGSMTPYQLITSYKVEEIKESHIIEIPSQKILLAEDNKINQKVAEKLLENLGHTITVAKNGKEALELFEKKKFDMILMDIQMPVMDGEEATKAIRRIERKLSSHIIIIALTANAMKGDRERFLAAGMDDYIPKPIKKYDLMKILSKNYQARV